MFQMYHFAEFQVVSSLTISYYIEKYEYFCYSKIMRPDSNFDAYAKRGAVTHSWWWWCVSLCVCVCVLV